MSKTPSLQRSSGHPMHPMVISSTESTSSIDLGHLLAGKDSCIFSESITLDSLSSSSSYETPPFPLGCMVPMSTFLGFGSHLALSPKGSPMARIRVGSFCEADQLQASKATITVPTAPRLRTMLKENLCVKKWVDNLGPSEAPGHTPWADKPDDVPTASWIPEGSVYPPDAFREALSSAHRSQITPSWNFYRPPTVSTAKHTTTLLSRPMSSQPQPQPQPHPRPTSFRKALVFEREITLKSNGKIKKWSLQVPSPSTTTTGTGTGTPNSKPEMVDMMVELQNLNSFFKESLEDLDLSVAFLGQEQAKIKLDKPSLILSNSHSAIPLSLESISDFVVEAPLPPLLSLANRRGKKAPSPLPLFKPPSISTWTEDPYPSMPTPFLGSPSTYSPKFEFANTPDQPCMTYEDMVISLRSQCNNATPQPKLADEAAFEIRAPSQSVDLDHDEWSFADNLMTTYGGDMPDPRGSRSINPHVLSYPLDLSLESSADTPCATPDTSAVSIDITNGPDTPQSQFQGSFCQSSINVRPISKGPPTIPLPPTPSDRSSRGVRVRGILKNSKSVRFASLPNRRSYPYPNELLVDEIPIPVPVSPPPSYRPASPMQLSAGTPSVGSLRQPSPLRSSFNPNVQNQSQSVRTEATSPPAVQLAMGTTKPLEVIKKRRQSLFGARRPSNAKPPTPSTSPPASPKSPIRPNTYTSVSKPGLVHMKPPTGSGSLGRHSLGGNMKIGMGIENKASIKGRVSLPPSKATEWNENSVRRLGGQRDSVSKSRMPIPLRNILTRFK